MNDVIKDLGGRYKKPTLLHSGIDYFKASIRFLSGEYYRSKLKRYGLGANSTSTMITKEIMMEFEDRNCGDDKDYIAYYRLIDLKTNTSLGFIMIANPRIKGSVKLNDIIEVTGQGLVFNTFDFRIKFYKKYFDIEIIKFKRVDICMDLKIDVDYLYNKIFKKRLEKKTIRPYINAGVVTGFYIGNPDKQKNTYQLIRVYDKHLDNKEKGKKWLYPGYTNIKNIARLEVEIRRDKAELLKVEKLLDPNYVYSIFIKTFYGYNHKFFNQLKQENFDYIKKLELSKHKRRVEMMQVRLDRQIKYGNDFETPQEEKKAVATFISYGKRLFKNGYTIEKMSELLKINC